MLILSLLGAGFIALVAIEAETGIREVRSRQALYVAESGIEYGLWNLDTKGSSWSPDVNIEYSVAKGTFTLELIENGEETLISTGYIPGKTNATATRRVVITGPAGSLVSSGNHAFYNYAFWSSEAARLIFDYDLYSLETKADVTEADLYANGDVEFKNDRGEKIDGTVYSTGTVTSVEWSGPKDPWKHKKDYINAILPPSLDDDAKAWYEENADWKWPGSYSNLVNDNNVRLEEGWLYYVKGDLTIGNIRIKEGYGTFIATGNITVTGTIECFQNRPLCLVSFENISCNQDANPLDASLYADKQFIVGSASDIKIFGNLGSGGGLDIAGGTEIEIKYGFKKGPPATNSILAYATGEYTWKEVYK